ncbi:1-phosphofructokinase family hexose kinase [Paenibacillus ginsengihumi]|uniref:1-phosphofructokinase family hexose kinase n=1 Tax=Paenibacillus ginsengihumi TaxID=431596 RepID=UPI00037ED37B|nr:1-phosphofructokinase family hexose kinase [Paenibacillus ginsengihumi]
MITTVTLNAAVDKTYFVSRFEKGMTTRVERAIAVAGGKGINVARVLHLLGEPVTVTGLAGGASGRLIAVDLDRLGIRHDMQPVAGESRSCLNVIEESTGVSTELLEPGPQVAAAEYAAFCERLVRLARRSRLVCFSGSLPAGLPKLAYAELIRLARGEGADVFLDASGAALRFGIEAGPDMIKPNEAEASALAGGSCRTGEERLQLLNRLAARGIRCAVLSLGAQGAIASVDGTLYRVKPPPLQAVNAVGSGDAFVAGLAAAWVRGLPPQESLRHAAAAGGANALHPQAGFVRREDVDALLQQIDVAAL